MPKALFVEPFAARMSSMSPTGIIASKGRMMPTPLRAPHIMNASYQSYDFARQATIFYDLVLLTVAVRDGSRASRQLSEALC
jgi:hypothetical protein